ncbi:MAG: hypothetical protein B6D41_06920 [Chloroflexi bacterium UTCFX4]|nr:MAG: hypothetical protein B6D41_06920 [Chloroflexi bacterium UTCFX4]
MNTIQVRVPKAIEQLVEGEQDRLLRVALRMAAKTRAKELTQAQREASANVRRLEKKYGMTFNAFEKKLGAMNTAQAHEAYNDWFFWLNVLERVENARNAMEKLASAT